MDEEVMMDLRICIATLSIQAVHQPLNLIRRQETVRGLLLLLIRKFNEENSGEHSNSTCYDTLQNEDPVNVQPGMFEPFALGCSPPPAPNTFNALQLHKSIS
jgi:hypothetical protein